MTPHITEYLFNVVSVSSTSEVRIDATGSMYWCYVDEHVTNEHLGLFCIPLRTYRYSWDTYQMLQHWHTQHYDKGVSRLSIWTKFDHTIYYNITNGLVQHTLLVCTQITHQYTLENNQPSQTEEFSPPRGQFY